ncbi:peptide-N4-(N-acetyl-beta-glucosaminyl)asparagine amidase KNAG_0A01780 [Huiozyma naganishii CBS 8797]|uniref:Peptide-N(4)-(N-acetyl-beta-glucosaminyl)asparagine amidase n=1 Tax=Huiozyma naganishii (strain ATCC MYA-139 / BCRC 22969 / CBS 8797 / KCTC 17520 / NBRC 10181 / NCYC 3082 / Yp74L-3) TaxID=1071383 RepID=J7RT36_HUIN7|nr:hypothetical protein KNAG_0A01780 [Kazachstania naganishii CBS 8797]CCK67867.1 hypothetical protein KNAG_0A01780 [Kazachstania naganishii CBS 8797]
MDSGDVYGTAAAMFLERYKELVVSLFQRRIGSPDRSSRFAAVVQRCQFAKEIVQTSRRLCHVYDNPMWQSAVLDTFDLDLIYGNVDRMVQNSEAEYTDNLVKELLRYFKQDFFTWCDKPKCPQCGTNEHQEIQGAVGPTAEESQSDCGTVELYRCTQCQEQTRFPGTNDPVKLLQTRTGRCGEWCNVFTLVLKAFGLPTRYVVNMEDHVWCEYFSKNLSRWVHVDSCEQSFDQPYIYSKNWNKKMSYCIAYGDSGVEDVSEKYILQNALPRDRISEGDLQFVCASLTDQLRQGRSSAELYKLFCMDEQDRFHSGAHRAGHDSAAVETGRQSGSKEWTTMRNENGQ